MPKSFLNNFLGKTVLIGLLAFNLWHLLSNSLLQGQSIQEVLMQQESKLWIQLMNCLLFVLISYWLYRILKSKKIIEANGKTSFLLIALLLPFLLLEHQPFILNTIYLLLVLSWLFFMKIYNQSRIWQESFLISILIGLLSILKIELISMMPLLWIGISTIRTFEWRNTIFSLIGFVFPWIYLISYQYVMDMEFYIPSVSWMELVPKFELIILQCIVICAIVMNVVNSKSLGVQQQKQLRYLVLNILLLFCLSLLVDTNYLYLSFPLALMIIESIYSRTSKQWVFELGIGLLLTLNIVDFLIS